MFYWGLRKPWIFTSHLPWIHFAPLMEHSSVFFAFFLQPFFSVRCICQYCENNAKAREKVILCCSYEDLSYYTLYIQDRKRFLGSVCHGFFSLKRGSQLLKEWCNRNESSVDREIDARASRSPESKTGSWRDCSIIWSVLLNTVNKKETDGCLRVFRWKDV